MDCLYLIPDRLYYSVVYEVFKYDSLVRLFVLRKQSLGFVSNPPYIYLLIIWSQLGEYIAR